MLTNAAFIWFSIKYTVKHYNCEILLHVLTRCKFIFKCNLLCYGKAKFSAASQVLHDLFIWNIYIFCNYKCQKNISYRKTNKTEKHITGIFTPFFTEYLINGFIIQFHVHTDWQKWIRFPSSTHMRGQFSRMCLIISSSVKLLISLLLEKLHYF